MLASTSRRVRPLRDGTPEIRFLLRPARLSVAIARAGSCAAPGHWDSMMFDQSPMIFAGSRSVHSGVLQPPVLDEILLTEVNPGNGRDFGVEWPGADAFTVVVDDI